MVIDGPFGPWMPERCEKIKIYPKKAQIVLDNFNTGNRHFVQSSIDIVEKALKEGKWECNGETIIFSKEGVLLDGQNRLYACASTGIPLTSWVVFGQNPEAFKTIDRGRNRNLASDLSILGEINCNNLAATLQVICAYYDGRRDSDLIRSKYDTNIALQILKEHPKVRDSVHYLTTHKNSLGCPGRILSSVHYIAGATDNERVIAKRDEFFERLIDGVALNEGSPILAVRNRFLMMLHSPEARIQKGMGHISSFAYFHILVKGWNTFLMGHSLGKIQLSYKDSSRKELSDVPDIRSYFRKPKEEE